MASLRESVGPRLAQVAFAAAEADQAALLDEIAAPGSGYRLIVAERGRALVGFTSLRPDPVTGLGELGLTAVDPAHQGHGTGRRLIEVALAALRDGGMRAAMVGTDGDIDHDPARRLYAAAGFNISVPALHLYRAL